MQRFPYLGLIVVIVWTVFLSSCKTKKEVVYVPVPTADFIKNYYTDIVINYKLDKSGIKDTFNVAISDAFKNNFDIPEYDIKMTLSKPKEASVEIEGKSLLVVVPITVNVEKQTFLTNLKGKGTIEMSFVTDYDIDSTWNMKTKTSLSYHRWVEKPKLSVVGIQLPIEAIADIVISKSKTLIETGIDDAVKENLTLKQKMKETMTMFDQPIQLDPNMKAWLSVKPDKVLLDKIKNNRFYAEGKIGIKGYSTFTTYKPVSTTSSGILPKVFWSENIPDSSVFRMVADIKMMDINDLLKANLDGKTFTANDKSITLSNIITNCDYEKIRVVTDVKGAANGMLIIKGKPIYDPTNKGFRIEGIEIDFKTKNVIHKAASWIAEGKIRNELQNMLKFSINETIEEVQKNLDAQLLDFNKKYDLEMKIGIGSADVESFVLKPGQIEALMNSKFHLSLTIKSLRSFNKF